MAQRVFVKVLGFSDVERHALNTVFRLSEERETSYALWMPDAPEPPRLALVDGQSYEAVLEMASPALQSLKYIWVGPSAPQDAWRSFDRPLSWPEVVRSMDEVISPPVEVDFDLDLGDEAADLTGPDTVPSELEPPPKRALIVGLSVEGRLYLRARLALAGLTVADEAESGAAALAMAQATPYKVVLVDFALPDMDGWTFIKQLAQIRPAIPHVIGTKGRAKLGEHVRGWFAGMDGLFQKPPHPGKLHSLLRKI